MGFLVCVVLSEGKSSLKKCLNDDGMFRLKKIGQHFLFKTIVRVCCSGTRLSMGQMCCVLPTKTRMTNKASIYPFVLSDHHLSFQGFGESGPESCNFR